MIRLVVANNQRHRVASAIRCLSSFFPSFSMWIKINLLSLYPKVDGRNISLMHWNTVITVCHPTTRLLLTSLTTSGCPPCLGNVLYNDRLEFLSS